MRRTADLLGADPYPGSTPQFEEDHKEPGNALSDLALSLEQPQTTEYRWIYANGQLHVSPAHDHDELRDRAGISEDHRGPFAAGYVHLQGSVATWSAESNVALRGLSKVLEDYGKTVGWQWGGLVGGDGQPVADELGAKKSMWYREAKSGQINLAVAPFPGATEIEIRGKKAYVDQTENPGLLEWAEDFGLSLCAREYNSDSRLAASIPVGRVREWTEPELKSYGLHAEEGGHTPTIFDRDTGILHVGPEGTHHHQLTDAIDNRTGEFVYGYKDPHSYVPTDFRDDDQNKLIANALNLPLDEGSLQPGFFSHTAEIIHVDQPVPEEDPTGMEGPPHGTKRVPFYYHKPSGKVYMGKPGGLHPTLKVPNAGPFGEHMIHGGYWPEQGHAEVYGVPDIGPEHLEHLEATLKVPVASTAWHLEADPWSDENPMWRTAEYPGGSNAMDKMKEWEHLDGHDKGNPEAEPRPTDFGEIEGPIKCPDCGKTCRDFMELQLHAQEHEGLNPEPRPDGHFPWPEDKDAPLPLRNRNVNPTANPVMGSRQVQGASTRKQMLEHAAILDKETPDTSQITHTFPDGWTVRVPQTMDDLGREGDLMGNCVAEQDLGEGEMPYASLRDSDNIPHATWRNFQNGGGEDALGRHNSILHPKYRAYLDQVGVDYPTRECVNCFNTERYGEPSDYCLECGAEMKDPYNKAVMGSWHIAEWKERIPIPEGVGYWHEAPTTERARILQHGIQPARPYLHEQWGTGPIRDWLKDQPEGVYLWKGAPPPSSGPGNDIWHVPEEQVVNPIKDPKTNGWVTSHPVRPLLYHGGPEDAEGWPMNPQDIAPPIPQSWVRNAAVMGSWHIAAETEPKDMVQASIPFIYDVLKDHITTGHPGMKSGDIMGQFTPAGIVEGTYEPGGKVIINSTTNMPYSVYHLLQLWYYQHPTMEITSLEMETGDGSTTKLASGIPPEPGTIPIPEGHIRLYHYTQPQNLDSIRQNGLLRGKARGDAGGGLSEPSAGVWASTQVPSQGNNFVEFHAHPDEISEQAESPWRVKAGLETMEEWLQLPHHVIMKGDVMPQNFFAIHEPWQHHYRYMIENYPTQESAAQLGSLDWMANDPEYGPALELWRRHTSGKKVADASVGSYLKQLAATEPAVWNAYQALSKAGGKVYVVGGAVRDALLQKEPKDIDLMVQGLPSEEVNHILSNLPGRMDLTGRKFGVYRYNHNGNEVEVALPREDSYDEGGKRSEGQIRVDHTLPVEHDLLRRDFTANSMAVNLDDGRLIDPYGGAQDISANALRTTHPSSFKEDPTRLLRALVANSRFGLAPDEKTRQEMADNASRLADESPDALKPILLKLLESSNPARAVRLAQDTGLLHHIFPELAHNFDYDQKNPHHNYTLGEHSLHVLDNVSRTSADPDVRLAALLHDIGKPASAWTDENGINHYYQGVKDGEPVGADHAKVGAEMAEARLRKGFNYPVARLNRVRQLIDAHMFPAYSSAKGARKFLNKYGENADDLLTLREGDLGGKGTADPRLVPDGTENSEPHQQVEQMRNLIGQVRTQGQATDKASLAINGNDLIAMGMKPGPAIGQMLDTLMERVVDYPQLNNPTDLGNMAQAYINETIS